MPEGQQKTNKKIIVSASNSKVQQRKEGGFTQNLVLEQALIGRVMTQVTMIEHMINAYVADFYTRCPKADYQATYLAFMFDVMGSRGISLDTKIEILSKVYERSLGPQGKLNKSLFKKWLRVRNTLAHGTHIGGKGILYCGEFFEVQKLADDHAMLQVKIHLELERLSELRGPYFNLSPVKAGNK